MTIYNSATETFVKVQNTNNQANINHNSSERCYYCFKTGEVFLTVNPLKSSSPKKSEIFIANKLNMKVFELSMSPYHLEILDGRLNNSDRHNLVTSKKQKRKKKIQLTFNHSNFDIFKESKSIPSKAERFLKLLVNNIYDFNQYKVKGCNNIAKDLGLNEDTYRRYKREFSKHVIAYGTGINHELTINPQYIENIEWGRIIQWYDRQKYQMKKL